jgi:uncharacterized delta-60 repeat protein
VSRPAATRPSPWRRLLTAVVGAAALATPMQAGAAPGDLDPSFGTDGIVVVDQDGQFREAADMAVTSDGGALIAGTQFGGTPRTLGRVVRLTPEGLLDPAFGTAGIATVDLGLDTAIHAITVQPDGKIVAAGSVHAVIPPPQLGLGPADVTLPLVLRLNPNGALDLSFGVNGVALVGSIVYQNAFDGVFEAVAVQPDGKVVAGGSITTGGTAQLVVRYTAAGRPDTTFANQSALHVGAGSNVGELVVQPDGKLVVVGTTATKGWKVNRYLADGAPDPGFGGSPQGEVAFDAELYTGADRVEAAMLPDGRIVLAGERPAPGRPSDREVTLERLAADGSRDTSFTVTTVTLDAFGDVALGIDDTVFVSGTVDATAFGLVAIGSGGGLDPSIGDQGVRNVLANGYARSVAVSPAGSILLAGSDLFPAAYVAARLEGPVVVEPATCFGEAVTVNLGLGDEPTAGRDVILGTRRGDVVNGLGGADLICGLGGPDRLAGGPGRDRIDGGGGPDNLTGDGGRDHLIGGTGRDVLDGGAKRDTCDGGPGRDEVRRCERTP